MCVTPHTTLKLLWSLLPVDLLPLVEWPPRANAVTYDVSTLDVRP